MEGGSRVIQVSQEQLDQVEYLLQQSAQGHHILFDPVHVREILTRNPAGGSVSDEESYGVEHHIERLIEQPSLERKRAYLEGLDAETYELVVRTYFNIVENSIYESLEVTH